MFKLTQDKEQENINKYNSPSRINHDEEASTNLNQSSDYNINHTYEVANRNSDKPPPYIMINQSSSRNLISKRSQSVSVVAKNQNRINKIQRFFDFEQERSKSRISRLLNQPIEIPSIKNSSFIQDQATGRKSKVQMQQPPIRLILNKSETTQVNVRPDQYIGDDEGSGDMTSRLTNLQPHIVLNRNSTTNNQKNMMLPQITINSRNQQNYSSLTQNNNYSNNRQYLNQNSSVSSLIQEQNINKQSHSTIVKVQQKQQTLKPSRNQSITNNKSRSDLDPAKIYNGEFQEVEEDKDKLSPTARKERELSKDISREQNAFKRQQMLFELIDNSKDRNMSERSIEMLFNKKNLLQNAKSKNNLTPAQKIKFSILKSEKLGSSIIQEIQPTFPLQKDINMFQQIQMEDDRELKIKISDIIQNKNPLNSLLQGVKDIEKVFDLEQAIYRNKMEGMNQVMDQKLEDVKLKYLDDEYIYKQFKEQLDQKAKVKGKKLSNIKKYSEFNDLKWNKMTELFDHQGNKISKTGLKMDEEQRQKEQEEEMKRKLQLRKLTTKTSRQLNIKAGNQSNSPISLGPSSPTVSGRKRAVSGTDQDHNSLGGGEDQTSNINEDYSSDNNEAYSPNQIKQLKDQDLMAELKNMELKDLVARQQVLQKKIKKLEMHRSRVSRKQIEKMKIRLEKLQQVQQARIQQLKEEMTQEEQEYWEEQNHLRQQELLNNMDNFMEGKQREIQMIGDEIFQMENNSDDEFGVYENFANTQAHMMAKQKVLAKAKQKQRGRDTQKMLITIRNKKHVMENIVKGIQDIQDYNTHKDIQQKIGEKIRQSMKGGEATFNTQGLTETMMLMNQSQIREANENKGLQKVMQQVQKKQEFGKLIQEVYEKNEDIEYVKKKKKKQVKDKSPRQDRDDEEGHQDSHSEDQEEYKSDFSEDSKSSTDQIKPINLDYNRDFIDKEEIYEQQQLEMKIQEEQQNNMARKYLQFCKNEKVLPLPILDKIDDGVLALEDYKLNYGLCKALGSVLDDLGAMIRKIVLKNNGINDASYGLILEGALQNKNIKSLHLKGNEFAEVSLSHFLTYFKNEKRPSIEEIVISNCKQKLSQTNQLLKKLSDYNGLKVLGLCQSKLDKESCQLLADVANGNPNLRELDLAWNEVTSLNMWELVQNIEFCKHISFLNLSFNSLRGSKTNDIVQSLCNFIRRNRNLQHLDISYCGLRLEEVFEVTKACKKSRSLLAIHLSGNIINEEIRKKIRDHLRTRKRVKNVYELINNPDDEADTTEIPEQQTYNKNIDIDAAIKEKLTKYNEMDQGSMKKGEKSDSTAMKGNPGERLIFSRILGHFEIPHSYQWHESNECWICERYKYTVIVASKSIAQKCFKKPVSQKEKQFVIQKIKDAKAKRDESIINEEEHWGSDDDELFYDADNEMEKHLSFMNQQIAGTFSRGQLKSMLPLREFMRRLYKSQKHNVTYVNIEKSQYEKQLIELQRLREEKSKAKLQRQKEISRQYKNMLKFDQSENPQWLDRFKDGDDFSSKWIKELEINLPYQQKTFMAVPFDKLIEATVEKKNFLMEREKVYVYAQYMPPGKHNSCLVYNTTNIPQKDLYSFFTVIKPREEIIPINHKRVKEYKIERIFEKSISMFKDYIDDSLPLLKKAFEKDLENSKISRFIKDQFEFRRVCDVLIEFTKYIKDLFTYSIALSSFPSISWIDFTNLCQDWQIPDNRTCTMQTIDRVFIATNVELVEQEDNPDRDLCRFEFYEIIVRMGGAKYKDSGQVQTWDASTRKLIECNLMPNSEFMGGQSFRNQYVWTLPIDDLFRANIDGITKIYNKYCSLGKKQIDLDDCSEIMAPLAISEFSIKQCYAFSKMTIVDEMNQKEKYERMTLIEFLDFIVRCAYIKYKEEKHLTILEKTERVLDVLLKDVQCRRQRPNYEIEVSSESDYSSED